MRLQTVGLSASVLAAALIVAGCDSPTTSIAIPIMDATLSAEGSVFDRDGGYELPDAADATTDGTSDGLTDTSTPNDTAADTTPPTDAPADTTRPADAPAG
jgi:hypothetical protein